MEGGGSLPRIGYSWQNEQKILQAQAKLCITDSLSHTMCVENNKCFCARINLSSTLVESTPVKSLNSHRFYIEGQRENLLILLFLDINY